MQRLGQGEVCRFESVGGSVGCVAVKKWREAVREAHSRAGEANASALVAALYAMAPDCLHEHGTDDDKRMFARIAARFGDGGHTT